MRTPGRKRRAASAFFPPSLSRLTLPCTHTQTMQRDLLKSRLSRLPNLPPLDPPAASEGHDEDDSDEERDAFDLVTAPAVRCAWCRRIPCSRRAADSPSAPSRPGTRRRIGAPGSSSSTQYAPLSAEGTFSSALEVSVRVSSLWADASSSSSSSSSARERDATFRTYYTAPRADDEAGNGTVFVCVHGAGYSALSFAELARALAGGESDAEGEGGARGRGKGKGRGRVGVLAYDARGHGAPVTLRYSTGPSR